MGRNGNRLHGNGREWECKKPFPGISTLERHECPHFIIVIDGVFCVGRACDKQTRDAFQQSRLTGVTSWTVITYCYVIGVCMGCRKISSHFVR